jgi:hypothetical protein
MDRRALLPTGLALAGLVVVLLGLHQELLTARAAGGPTVTTGWGRGLNHEERLLGAVATAALPLAAAAARFRLLGYLVATAGAAVTGVAVWAAGSWLAEPWVSTGVPGDAGTVVIGAEPYLLVVGGLLLFASGLVAARGTPVDAGDRDAPARSPAGV